MPLTSSVSYSSDAYVSHCLCQPRICRCRRTLDPLGDHRATCAQAGVLRGRGRPIRRSSAPGRTQIQGAHIPRTSPFQTVQARGPRPRDRGPVEPGSNHFPSPLGPNKSQSSSQHPPQSCRSFLPLTLVSHPHTCGPACIRGQSPGLRLRRHQHS